MATLSFTKGLYFTTSTIIDWMDVSCSGGFVIRPH